MLGDSMSFDIFSVLSLFYGSDPFVITPLFFPFPMRVNQFPYPFPRAPLQVNILGLRLLFDCSLNPTPPCFPHRSLIGSLGRPLGPSSPLATDFSLL